MDLDAFSAAHRAEWDRLDALARRRALSGREADELIERYQAGATQLSAVTSTAGDTVVGERLSLALSRARLRFTGVPADPLRQLRVFFGLQLPAAMYRVRWLTLAIALATVIIGVAYGVWVANDPRVQASLGDAASLKQYAEKDFVGYYSESSESVFALQVWTNNAWIAAQCIGLGWTGVWPIAMIFQNAQNVGIAGGIMTAYGHGGDFALYIAPHGQLELYSIFLAAAAGLFTFWSIVVPGHRTRAQAMREDGRAFFTLVIGCTITLLMSGLIEGAVTRQPWPWPVKIGIGTIALAAVLFYQWGVGGRAARAGQTGDLDRVDAGATQIVEG
jgi:uncharacterized membrane protein SpoIIM required for sporulation